MFTKQEIVLLTTNGFVCIYSVDYYSKGRVHVYKKEGAFLVHKFRENSPAHYVLNNLLSVVKLGRLIC